MRQRTETKRRVDPSAWGVPLHFRFGVTGAWSVRGSRRPQDIVEGL